MSGSWNQALYNVYVMYGIFFFFEDSKDQEGKKPTKFDIAIFE